MADIIQELFQTKATTKSVGKRTLSMNVAYPHKLSKPRKFWKDLLFLNALSRLLFLL